MAVTAKWYSNAMLTAFNKEWDFDTDTIKVLLTTSSYTPTQSTDKYKDAVSAIGTNEVSGAGYTTGGATLGTKTNTNSSLTTTLDAADVTWSTSTITNARYAVIYDDSPASNKPLLAYIDFGANQSTSASDFQIIWNASGIASVTVS